MKTPLLLRAMRPVLIPLLLAAALNAPLSQAQTISPPNLMSYQGYLTDGSGNPLGGTNTGPKNYNVIFRFWNVQSGGTTDNELYAEQQTVTVDNGYFSVLLGEGSQYPGEPYTPTISSVFTNSQAARLFVEFVVLNIGPGGANVTIAPRLQLLTSPYAFLTTYASYALNAGNAANANTLINGAGGTLLIATNGTTLLVNGPVQATGLNVNGPITNTGPAVMGPVQAGTLNVTGTATAATLNVTGIATAATLNVTGPATAATLNVTGPATAAALNVTGPATNATLNVTATATASAFVGNGAGLTGIDTNSLVQQVVQALCPPGTIIAFGGANIPAGWLLCDGTSVSQTTYARLFSAISTNWGNSTGGTTNFNLPDLRGMFLRGVNGTRTNLVTGTGYLDPDVNNRTNWTQGNLGNAVGSVQFDALQNVTGVVGAFDTYAAYHGYSSGPFYSAYAFGSTGIGSGSGDPYDYVYMDLSKSARTSTETRPVNAYVNYIIKY